ncbi:hypothetical protein PBRA_008953 [Plasmodiophora brassicae]|uniref:MADF domain-containing protein n=1 Tax=Plasmodiophora brassicae TaxID=37360 RepID=A0A0G4J4R8_PLABS|nr:hypothetical protein PBRA_008953 [Plasmodiophora brassicae]
MEKSDVETHKRKRGRYFLDARNKQQLLKGWQRLAVMFNNPLGMDVPVEKIENKYQQVVAQYRKLKAADRETGNNPM